MLFSKTKKLNESTRTYFFKNGETLTIYQPRRVTETRKGRHIVVDSGGQEFEIPNRWTHIEKQVN